MQITTRMCEREKKDIGKNVWAEREKYYERNGYAWKEVEKLREQGRRMCKELIKRDDDIQKQEGRGDIKNSRYNAKYANIMCESSPAYLLRECKEERKIIARFRCRNEESENKFWLTEEERVYRLYRKEKETVEHILKKCDEIKEREDSREEILEEDGRGLEWMREVWKARGGELQKKKV